MTPSDHLRRLGETLLVPLLMLVMVAAPFGAAIVIGLLLHL